MTRQRGFTLLEVIVVLVIVGFLIAGIGQAVRFGLIAWDTQGRLTRTDRDLEAVDRTLRLLVKNLSPGDGSGKPPIIGTASSLAGISRIPVPSAGLTDLPVEAALALSGQRLVLRWRIYTHGAPIAAAPAREDTLADGVTGLTIAYWEPPGRWVGSWNQPDLPPLIRLRIRLGGAGATRWPDLVVAPLLSPP